MLRRGYVVWCTCALVLVVAIGSVAADGTIQTYPDGSQAKIVIGKVRGDVARAGGASFMVDTLAGHGKVPPDGLADLSWRWAAVRIVNQSSCPKQFQFQWTFSAPLGKLMVLDGNSSGRAPVYAVNCIVGAGKSCDSTSKCGCGTLDGKGTEFYVEWPVRGPDIEITPMNVRVGPARLEGMSDACFDDLAKADGKLVPVPSSTAPTSSPPPVLQRAVGSWRTLTSCAASLDLRADGTGQSAGGSPFRYTLAPDGTLKMDIGLGRTITLTVGFVGDEMTTTSTSPPSTCRWRREPAAAATTPPASAPAAPAVPTPPAPAAVPDHYQCTLACRGRREDCIWAADDAQTTCKDGCSNEPRGSRRDSCVDDCSKRRLTAWTSCQNQSQTCTSACPP